MSPLPFRKLVKAISVPSGDHAGASLPTTSNCDRADANGTPTRSRTAPDAIGRSRRMVSSSIAHRLPEMLGAVIAVMLCGFITGALARLAVPGPDPMPVWLTTAIGLTGSVAGFLLAVAIWGRKAATAAGLLSFGIAIVLVLAYRRFYQGRPLTGPEALKFPERGVGLDRFRERRAQMEQLLRQQQHAQSQQHVDDINEQIRNSAEIDGQGNITDEDFA